MPMTDIPPTVRYALTESPIGPLLVAATDEKIVQVAFENQDFERIFVSAQSSIRRGSRA